MHTCSSRQSRNLPEHFQLNVLTRRTLHPGCVSQPDSFKVSILQTCPVRQEAGLTPSDLRLRFIWQPPTGYSFGVLADSDVGVYPSHIMVPEAPMTGLPSAVKRTMKKHDGPYVNQA